MWRIWLNFAFQAKIGGVSGKKRINSFVFRSTCTTFALSLEIHDEIPESA